MAVERELGCSLEEHILRAGPAVDAAIAAGRRVYVDYAALPEVQALKAAPPDELRSIVIVLMERPARGDPGG